MSSLIAGDRLEVVVESRTESGGGELSLGIVGKTFTVELVLEVLKSQGVVEDLRYERSESVNASLDNAGCAYHP